MAAPPPRFEVEDTVVLRGRDSSEPHLIGRVERTYHALDSHDPVEDCLIIAYVPVDTDTIKQFTASGRPPKGYLFVEFAHEEAGHALLPEGCVSLLSRALAIGDSVKQDANGAMFGTVIDIKSSYVLTPVFSSFGDLNASQDLIFENWMNTLPSGDDSRLAFDTNNQSSPSVLYDVKGDDLKRAEDFQSGDHVVSRDWFGVVEASDIDVAVLLDNKTIVWVEKPWELEIVVTNPWNKPLVSMPEFDEIRRPDILNVHRNGVVSMPSKRLGCGDNVVTNRRNIERGRWLVGQYDPSALPQGSVLDVRTRRLDINWLVPNAFVDSAHEHMPPNSLRPYENLTSFRNPRELRARKDLARYDHDRKPIAQDAVASGTHTISAGDVYYPGDRVRFRSSRQSKRDRETESRTNTGSNDKSDQRSMGNNVRNDRIGLESLSSIDDTKTSETENPRPTVTPRTENYGFDLNEYMICMGYHEAVVLWQDGTESTLESTRLTPYSLPESDLCPGDLVIAKEGLKMIGVDAAGATSTSDFNEMNFFERDHVLQPAKVGVIQSVDAQERLARVRWYADPHIRLGAYGQVLQEVHFGKIGEDFEDVSLYEIMTEPALIRKLGDLVVIPPRNTARPEALHTFSAVPADLLAENPPGPTTLSYLRQLSSHVLPALWEIARPFADMIHPMPPSTPKYDWIGEIVRIGLDGSVTVRLGSMKDCRDVSMSHDDILLIVDENVEFYEPDEHMEIDSNGEQYPGSQFEGGSIDLQSDDESAIDEIVEYEGGARLDIESGEDEWSTDDDDDDDVPESLSQLIGANDEGDLQDTEMGGTGSCDENGENDLTEHPQRDWQANATNFSNAGGHISTDRNPRGFIAQIPPVKLVSESENLVQAAAVLSLTQFLHQRQSPSSFEVLEQMPPPDQYHRAEGQAQNSAFLKRIAKEHRILASSLPDGEIYVRTYESRLDLLRCLIVGPANTPYEYCPFVIDLHLGPDFPNEPPKAHFHSWTSGLGRINPNLYEEGKICLSLLGTWPGQSEREGWSDKATILQVLVSLQGLVFVSQPFYNEAGFETYGEEKVYSLESQQYSEKAYVMARGFVKYALVKAPSGLEDVLTWLYLCIAEDVNDSKPPPRLLETVIQRAKLLMERSSGLKQQATLEDSGRVDTQVIKSSFLIDGVGDSTDKTKVFLKPLSQGASVMLKKTVVTLENTLQRYDKVAAEGQVNVS